MTHVMPNRTWCACAATELPPTSRDASSGASFASVLRSPASGPLSRAALLKLESEGAVLRGHFSGPEEWCDRRLLARIHRYTLNRLRAEIEPVGAADFMRFLFSWQHVAPSAKLTGIDGLQAVGAARRVRDRRRRVGAVGAAVSHRCV